MKEKLSCIHCEAVFTISHDMDENYFEITMCPFCGGEASIEEDDVDFLDNEEEQDDWN